MWDKWTHHTQTSRKQRPRSAEDTAASRCKYLSWFCIWNKDEGSFPLLPAFVMWSDSVRLSLFWLLAQPSVVLSHGSRSVCRTQPWAIPGLLLLHLWPPASLLGRGSGSGTKEIQLLGVDGRFNNHNIWSSTQFSLNHIQSWKKLSSSESFTFITTSTVWTQWLQDFTKQAETIVKVRTKRSWRDQKINNKSKNVRTKS